MYTCRYPDLYKLHQMIRNCRANYCWTKITGWNEINHSQQDIIPVPPQYLKCYSGFCTKAAVWRCPVFHRRKVSLFHLFFNDPYGLGVITLLFFWVAQETVEWRNIRDERDVSHSCARIQSIGHGQNLSAADAPLEIP